MVATPTTNLAFQNFFSTTLSADITDTATDIFLTAVPNGTEGFLVINPDSASLREVVYYTSKTALKVTVPSVADGRGQDDTTAHPHTSGETVIMAPVAAYFEAMQTLFQTTPAGWTSITGSISAVTNNGQRSYSLTTSSDNSAVISPGMRLRTTRTVAAPTQSTSLNGTTQFYNKTTPAGMTFTDDFTCMGWIKPSSYALSGNGGIISRHNGSTGWIFLTEQTTGRLQIFGQGAANRGFQTYQAIPPNQWTHVAATIDMSAGTATMYINGVLVPSVSYGGVGTSLTQAGNLEVGSYAGANFFPGKIAQAAVFSSVLSAATIRSYMSQGLSGSETSLVSAYSFNNSVNDLNVSNANNLTANGSAIATNADSPFGNSGVSSTFDYHIVQTVSSSTLVVQSAEGCAPPTSGGVTAASYSSFRTPYGFPGQTDKWMIQTPFRIFTASTSNATYGSFAAGGFALTVPIGAWNVGWSGGLFSSTNSVEVKYNMSATALTGLSVTANNEYAAAMISATSAASAVSYVNISNSATLSAQSTYVMYSIGSTTASGLVGDTTRVWMYATNAYL